MVRSRCFVTLANNTELEIGNILFLILEKNQSLKMKECNNIDYFVYAFTYRFPSIW